MNIFLLILSLTLGYFFFQGLEELGTEKITSNPECKIPIPKNKSDIPISSKLNSKCLPYVPNKGMVHDRSETQSKAKIYNFFNEQLKEYYIAPNEFNVVTNDSGFGESAQKYDPREDLYIRFDKVQSFDKNSDYGVVSGFHDIPKFLESKKCSPVFNPIGSDETMDFNEILSGRTLSQKEKSYEYYMRTNDFSFFDVLSSYGVDFELFRRYRLFRNNCNKAVSILLNFCYLNPNYDLQYEDMFILKDQGVAISNIFCKKSNDKTWSLLSTHKFEMK